MGLHLLVAMPLALIFRANSPITFAIQMLTNIFTIVIYFPAAYLLGCFMMNEDPAPHYHQLTEVICHADFSMLLSRDLLPILWPLLIGCTVIGFVAGALGYILVMAFWPGARPKIA